jgi:acyl-coenzyme A thioesterase PaaI-like protein
VLEEGEWAVTAEVKISYLRALQPGALDGSARVLRRSRTLAFLEAEVSGLGGGVAIRASSTWAISRRA